MAKNRTGKKLAILITCVGRRVELVHAFRRAGRQLKLDLLIVGSDANRLAPGLWVCDRQIIEWAESGRAVPFNYRSAALDPDAQMSAFERRKGNY